MKRLRAAWLRPALACAVVAAVVTGCQDVQGPGGDAIVQPAPAALIVSNPTPVLSAAAASAPGGSGSPGLVYVSLPSGTLPAGVEITIQARQTGAVASTALTDGGFDPLPVAASAEDTLDLTVALVDGGAVRFVAAVPRRRPPVVVRTSPPAGKRDVPLNSVMLIVFSEPIDSTTLTASAVQVTRGGVAVRGALAFADAAHLSVTFTPVAPLAANASYALTVDATIADGDGDLLDTTVTATFTTGAFGSVTYDRVTPSADSETSRLVLGDSGRFRLELRWPQFGYLEEAGAYAVSDSAIELTFDFAPCCQGPAWGALASFHGDSLVVHHDNPPTYPPIEDAVFVRASPPPPLGVSGRVAFSAVWYTTSLVYVASPDGSGLTPLAEGQEPSWSWDGRRIAYVLMPPSGIAPEVRVMDADGKHQVQVATGRTPAWSPDGSRIAFSEDTAIVVINADGTGRTVLATVTSPGMPPGVVVVEHPTWSPDGTRIAFQSLYGPGTTVLGATQIHLVDVSGANLRNLSDDGWSKYAAAWSADGSQIFAVSYDDVQPAGSLGYDLVLALYDAGTGARQVLYRTHTGWLTGGPALAPGGRFVGFTQQSAHGTPSDLALVLDLQTGDVRSVLHGVAGVRDLAWSR